METDNFDDFKIILWLILFLVFGILIITCKSTDKEIVMTVNGPVAATSLGVTLEHEHVLVDFSGADSIQFSSWDRAEVIRVARPYFDELKKYNVRTFIECTPAFLGRDPLLLKELGKETGMNFITNTGFYGAHDNRYIPGFFDNMTAEEASEMWTNEFLNGIEGSGVKPGFIKIAVNPDDSLSALHQKIITAAGLTHLKTGLTIASHTGPDSPAFAQIKILSDNGIDPSAFIWVHAQRGSIEGNIRAAEMGTWISLDNIRNRSGSNGSITWYADRIQRLKEEGHLNRVLLSHDSGWYDPGKPGGGTYNGYTDLFEYLLPELGKRGFSEDDIKQLMIRNPAEAYTIKKRISK